MENKLITQFQTLTKSSGVSNEMLDITGVKNPFPKVEELMWNLFFSKSDEKILYEIIETKKAVYKTLYQIDFCPFNILTKVSWEEMLKASIVRHEKFQNGGMKIVLPWMHVVTSSAHYSFIPPKEMTRPVDVQFCYTGEEYVEIDGIRYALGEAKIVADRFPAQHDAFTPHLRLIQPTIIFDEKLIPFLVNQKEWPRVLEIIYLLYHMTSHDGLIHSVFMETCEKIRATAGKDSVMKKFYECHYYCYTMYEMNFARMMRAVFDLIGEINVTLRKNTEDLLSEVESLCKNWLPVLRQYICFIATQRMIRFVPISYSEDLPRYLGGLVKGGLSTIEEISKDDYLYNIIHSQVDKEALLHEGHRGEIKSLSFEDMTKFMFNCYVTVK
ncbi:hypothetical protein IT403_00575 [Candidatus Nomurabacteria bacterium]|nr:hypothetical protein [Candidatus Nomurabacteria bacterium]